MLKKYFKPKFGEDDITKENVLDMILRIKGELKKIDVKYERLGLKEILPIIEKGGLNLGKNGNCVATNYFDLSKAKAIIKKYKEKSEGCFSCNHYRNLPLDEDGGSRIFCGVYDKDKWYLGISPTIKKYSNEEHGCVDKFDSRFKTIDQMILEYESGLT